MTNSEWAEEELEWAEESQMGTVAFFERDILILIWWATYGEEI